MLRRRYEIEMSGWEYMYFESVVSNLLNELVIGRIESLE